MISLLCKRYVSKVLNIPTDKRRDAARLTEKRLNAMAPHKRVQAMIIMRKRLELLNPANDKKVDND